MRIRTSTVGNRKPALGGRARRAGFTLLELIVVLIIMGIVLGVTGPRLVGSLGGDEVTRFSKVVASYLRNAREVSIVRNVPVEVTLDEGERSIVCLDARGGRPVLSSIEIPEALRVSLRYDSGQPSDAVHFYPLGNATGSRVVLEGEKGGSMTVAVESITGEVYIE